MATKTRARIFFALLLFAALKPDGSVPGIYAQDNAVAPPAESSAQPNYHIDRSGNETRFFQRLVWEDAEYVTRYEVAVERLGDDGAYSEAERQSTQTPFAEFSLPPGRYRYRVGIYDLLDTLSFTTEWLEFDIFRAFQPEISGFSPAFFSLDDDGPRELTVRGQNLLPESEICLVRKDLRIVPKSSAAHGDAVRLVFSEDSLAAGDYSVYAKNPGGLETRLGTFRITGKKPFFDLNISLGYAPVVPLYGFLFRDFDLEAPFPDSFYPLGALIRIGILPFSGVWGNLGTEISGSFSQLSGDRAGYTTKAFFWNAHLDLLYQKYFFNDFFALNISLGAGVTIVHDFHYEYSFGPPAENKTTPVISAMFGLSGMFFAAGPFYIHAGADFIHAFSIDQPMPGFIRPFIAAGWKL